MAEGVRWQPSGNPYLQAVHEARTVSEWNAAFAKAIAWFDRHYPLPTHDEVDSRLARPLCDTPDDGEGP